MVKRGNEGERYAVIAIHKGAPLNAKFNEARIITDDLITKVLAWEKEMTNPRIKFCLMTNSDQETLETDTENWLKEKNIKF